MSTQTVTLQVPEVLYTRLKERAAQTHRSLEAEVIDVLAGAVPVADALPADLETAVSALTLLDDEALWRAARGRPGTHAARFGRSICGMASSGRRARKPLN